MRGGLGVDSNTQRSIYASRGTGIIPFARNICALRGISTAVDEDAKDLRVNELAAQIQAGQDLGLLNIVTSVVGVERAMPELESHSITHTLTLPPFFGMNHYMVMPLRRSVWRLCLTYAVVDICSSLMSLPLARWS